ncbi:MAG: iron ABC transporter permease [Paenibacillus dendritiformis]|uniref:FecCD family ABC transporter permease n=1 Tax=Paenibacillus dendritiformis TaxID=130049 RepID=UPI001B2CD9DA|nr:iron ABC transporter permease [Paenibacillus dendritiformis]MDU5142801.1 iron ABC transporter permease [Paenibacillus dendritiformis]GIO70718.1 siderophore ABC transporter permease [Paenibacillus dendritiformis]
MRTSWLSSSSAKWIGCIVGIFVLLGCIWASIVYGVFDTKLHHVWEALTDYQQYAGSNEHIVIREVRIPRALIAAAVGASLGISGVILQSLTKNPLADAGIFGINASSSLFVVFGFIFFQLNSLQSFTWLALAGACAGCLLVFLLGSSGGRQIHPIRMTLAGSAIAALSSSLTNGLLISNHRAMEEVLFWIAGSVEGRKLEVLVDVLPYMAIAWIGAWVLAKPMDTLNLGDDVAVSLGLKVAYIKWGMGLLIVMLAGSSVAVAGPIGFLGLVVPHIARSLVGIGMRWLVVYSGLIGAIVLLLADIGARFIAEPKEIPIGVMTAIIGVPFFVYAARKGVRG